MNEQTTLLPRIKETTSRQARSRRIWIRQPPPASSSTAFDFPVVPCLQYLYTARHSPFVRQSSSIMPAFFNRLNAGATSTPASGASTPSRQPAPQHQPVQPPPQRAAYDRVPQADPYGQPQYASQPPSTGGAPPYGRPSSGMASQAPPALPSRGAQGAYQDDPYGGARQHATPQQTPSGYSREKAEYRPRGNGSGV